MEINEKDKQRWKLLLLDLLKKILLLCKDNNIRCYCSYGTVLGAIRHRGYIPWDDDIDIMMPRPDYDRFLSLFETLSRDDLELITCYNNKFYDNIHSKVCLRDTSLIEIENQPYLEGLYVDIFPLDGCSSNKDVFMRDMDRFRHLLWKFEAMSVPFNLRTIVKYTFKGHYHILRSLPYYLIKPFQSRRKTIMQIDSLCKQYGYDESEYVVSFAGSYGYKERLSKEWIGDGVEQPFENLNVPIPSDSHAYLTHYYGDYMQLPPINKRASHHLVAYYNLDRRVFLDEIKC